MCRVGRPLVALYYGRVPSHLGVEGIWSPGLMASGRRHDDLIATSIELGYTDCRELAMSTVGIN